jgi:glycosyltransferase involved in cell wall biosynthesis
MRIWILNHYASAPDTPTGTRHYEFGRELAAQGHEVTIFASSFSHFSRQEERLSRTELMREQNIDGVRFVWVRTIPYKRNNCWRALNMLSYALVVPLAQGRFSRPDVIVGSSVHLGAAAAACLISWARRVPFVFEVRDLWPQTLIDMGALRERSPAARVLRGAELFLYGRARLVISLLPGASEYIAGRGIPREKIVYIPNGVPASRPISEDAPAELLSRITECRRAGRMIAGYVGSHGRANGLDTLLGAARDMRDRGEDGVVFVFVGQGPEKQWCEQFAREHSLDNVLFWEPVPKRAVPSVLAALDVALFSLRDVPVFKYGLSSNKLFDYLASRRPVVAACAVPGNPVSVSGAGICVPPESPKAVADALLDMVVMGSSGRKLLGEIGQSWVQEHHGSAILASRFLQALAQVRQ